MATAEYLQRLREILERVSRVVEAAPGATGREVRVRARVSRRTGDEALELLRRGGFVNHRWGDGDWHYTSALPYRADDHAPRATFAGAYATGQGGER